MTEVSVCVVEEMEAEEVEIEVCREGGGWGRGVVVDAEVAGSARHPTFRIETTISHGMISNETQNPAEIDSNIAYIV